MPDPIDTEAAAWWRRKCGFYRFGLRCSLRRNHRCLSHYSRNGGWFSG